MTTLKFDLGGIRELPTGAEVPLQVRMPDTSIVAETHSNGEVELKPGLYFVTAQLPGKAEVIEKVRIRPGDAPKTVALKAEAAPEVIRRRPRAGRIAGLLQAVSKVLGEASRGAWSMVTLPATRNARLRLFAGNLLADEVDFETWEDAQWEAASPDEKRLPIRKVKKPAYAQLLQIGHPPVNIALPAWGEADGYLVLRRKSRDELTIHAEPGHAQAALLVRYAEQAMAHQVASVAVSKVLTSEQLLREKGGDPVAAAAAAYAFLRLGELERLAQWTGKLTERFPGLPDGAAAHGEYLARTGQHSEALDSFLEIADRGLPLFGEGLSLAETRLRLYTDLEEHPFSEEQIEAARALSNALRRFVPYTDFARPVTVFTGLEPLAPNAETLGRFTKVGESQDIGHLFKD